jgi:hypothetical protein
VVWKIEWFGDYQSTNSRPRHLTLHAYFFLKIKAAFPGKPR